MQLNQCLEEKNYSFKCLYLERKWYQINKVIFYLLETKNEEPTKPFFLVWSSFCILEWEDALQSHLLINNNIPILYKQLNAWALANRVNIFYYSVGNGSLACVVFLNSITANRRQVRAGNASLSRDKSPHSLYWACNLAWEYSALFSLQNALLFSYSFWPHCMQVLFPQPDTEPMPPALEEWSLNHWFTRKSPALSNFDSVLVPVLSLARWQIIFTYYFLEL